MVGQQLPEQAQRARRVTALAGPGRDVAPGGEGVGVVRAEHPLLVGQQLPEQAQRARRVTALAGPGRDVAPGGEGVGVVRAEHPLLVGQQLPGQAQRARRVTALAGPVRDVVPGGEGVGVVGGLDGGAEGEFVLAVGECLAVVAERAIVGGEGVVDAEPVIVGVGGQGGELGFQHDVLQPGIGARSRARVQDSPGRVFPLVVAGVQQRGEQPRGESRVPGAAGVEGQQQPPLVGGRAEGGGVLVQGRSGLVGEVKRRRALAAGAEQFDGGPDPCFQPEAGPAGGGLGDQLLPPAAAVRARG